MNIFNLYFFPIQVEDELVSHAQSIKFRSTSLECQTPIQQIIIIIPCGFQWKLRSNAAAQNGNKGGKPKKPAPKQQPKAKAASKAKAKAKCKAKAKPKAKAKGKPGRKPGRKPGSKAKTVKKKELKTDANNVYSRVYHEKRRQGKGKEEAGFCIQPL